jgi:GxxExxY protein
MLVEDAVLVELKAIKALDDIHRAQCLNYLSLTQSHSGVAMWRQARRLGLGAKIWT